MELNDHFMACSVCALNGISHQEPEATLKLYISKLSYQAYNSADKKYESKCRYGYYIHVFFAGPKHEGWTVNRDGHYSERGSCDAFAAYLREHKLGPVVETEGRWNHRHASRVKGQGDVVCYVWSPDSDALAAWHKEHK